MLDIPANVHYRTYIRLRHRRRSAGICLHYFLVGSFDRYCFSGYIHLEEKKQKLTTATTGATNRGRKLTLTDYSVLRNITTHSTRRLDSITFIVVG